MGKLAIQIIDISKCHPVLLNMILLTSNFLPVCICVFWEVDAKLGLAAVQDPDWENACEEKSGGSQTKMQV